MGKFSTYLLILFISSGMAWLVRNTVFMKDAEKDKLILNQLANEQLHISHELAWQLVGTNGDISHVKEMAKGLQFPVDTIYQLDLTVNGKTPFVIVFKN